jgi:hypothetical protein
MKSSAIWSETELAGGRQIGFDVSDSDRLTPQDDNTLGSSGWGLILRILFVVFLGVLFWQAVLASGRLIAVPATPPSLATA